MRQIIGFKGQINEPSQKFYSTSNDFRLNNLLTTY
jgi:hypothetical protein